MKLSSLYLVLLFSLVFSSVYAQLELNPQNKLTLNSDLVTGSDFSIGVSAAQGGLMINSSNINFKGITGYSLNSVLKGYNGFDHNEDQYAIGVEGVMKIGVKADTTQIFNLLKTNELNIGNKLKVGDEFDPIFIVDPINNKMYFNTNQDIGSSDFVLNSANATGFGGMYINSEDAVEGKPFYGYSNDSNISAYHHYDDVDNSWHLTVDGQEMLKASNNEISISDDFKVGDFSNAVPTFSVETGATKKMYFNTNTQVGLADFTLNSTSSTNFGGMFVNINDAATGKPFYGYSINNNGNVFHYFDASSGYWKLFNSTKDILQVDNKELFVSGSIRMGNKVGTQPEGTIYYNGFNFYGVTDGGVIRQLDNITNGQSEADNSNLTTKTIQHLEAENKELINKIESLESRLEKLENILSEK